MRLFTYDYYEEIFQEALKRGYKVITLKEFFLDEYDKDEKILVNRMDVDIRIDRLKEFYKIFKKLNIKASIYVRVHSPYYNLFSIGNILLIQDLLSLGCEIGIHTECKDLESYCKSNTKELLKVEIELFEKLFSTKIYGTASHGDLTPNNNLDFWKEHSVEEFDLIYEAYDDKLWKHCRYVSDSEWTQWKAYENGVLLENDRRDPIEHLEDNPKILHLLMHPESWYERYIYE